MISLEENILPKLESYLCNWGRYVDYIFAYVLPEKTDLIIHELNPYHPNIKFTYEQRHQLPLNQISRKGQYRFST